MVDGCGDACLPEPQGNKAILGEGATPVILLYSREVRLSAGAISGILSSG